MQGLALGGLGAGPVACRLRARLRPVRTAVVLQNARQQGRGRTRQRQCVTCSQLQVDRQRRSRSPSKQHQEERSLEQNRALSTRLSTTEFDTIPEMWGWLACTHGDRVAVIDEHHEPAASLTFAQLEEAASMFAAGISAWGIQPGDVVSIFSENSPRWLIADAAVMMCGAANAVRGSAAPASELSYILDHSRSRALIVEDAATLAKLLPSLLERSGPPLAFVAVLWGKPDPSSADKLPFPVIEFDQMLASGSSNGLSALVCELGGAGSKAPRTRARHLPQPSDLATIVYTSGTTGQPKGACLSHGNLMYQLRAFADIIRPEAGDKALSILPIWHVYERTAAYYISSCGSSIAYTSVKSLKNDLAKHSPEFFLAVPLVLTTLNNRVEATLRASSTVRRALVGAFVACSLALVQARRIVDRTALTVEPHSMGERLLAMVAVWLLSPLHALADRLAYSKIRAGLGVQKAIVSGGGALPPLTDDWYEAIGVTVLNGYGLTESSPVLACRRTYCNIRGTVGLPLPETQIRIVDPDTRAPVAPGATGLVLARGPGVMQGYHDDPQATARAIDRDGWFDTGDLGWVVPADGSSVSGNLVLVGRAKDTIVLSSGENVEPGPLEEALVESPLIRQVMLVGSGERSLGALVVPDADALQERAANQNGGAAFNAEEVHALIGKELHDVIHGRAAFRKDDRISRWKARPAKKSRS